MHTFKVMIKTPFKCESYTSKITNLFGDASLVLTGATTADMALVTSRTVTF